MSESELFQALQAVSYAPNYREWIFERVEKDLGETIFDVGSGLGDFLDLFLRDPKRKVILSDASGTMTSYLRERCRPFSEVRIAQGDISRDPFHAYQGLPDTVTCFNVLEHIEHDIQALKNMRQMIKPQGKLILFVPALENLYGALDQMAGHYRRYSRRKLTNSLQAAGWKVSRIEYFNFFGMFTWFLSGKILRQKQLHAQTCSRLDRLVPLLAWVEKGILPFAGQSLIAIAQ